MKQITLVPFILFFLLLQGCALGEGKDEIVQGGHDKIIGINEKEIYKMYVGNIKPTGSFEYHTTDKTQIKSAVEFLKKQNYTKAKESETIKPPGTTLYHRFYFYAKDTQLPFTSITFIDGEVEINNVKYLISNGSLEGIQKLFEELKSKELKTNGKLEISFKHHLEVLCLVICEVGNGIDNYSSNYAVYSKIKKL